MHGNPRRNVFDTWTFTSNNLAHRYIVYAELYCFVSNFVFFGQYFPEVF